MTATPKFKWLGLATVLLVLALVAGQAQAQYYGYPARSGYGTPAYQAYVSYARAYTAASIQAAYSGAHYGNPHLYGNLYVPAYGYGGMYPGFYYDPYGGYLRGAADVIGAQSRFMVSLQEAHLAREQVRAKQLENRRTAFDQYLYLREHTPTMEQMRAEERAMRRERAVSDPPITEIYAALALNELLADLQQISLEGVKDVPLDAAVVRRVHFTTTRNGANIGLVRNVSNLTWPLALRAETYKVPRERFTTLVQGSVERVQMGQKLDATTLTQMYDDLETLHQKLRDAVGDLEVSQFLESKRFLNHLGDALKAVQQPDAVNFFNGRYEFQGKGVGDLVKFMTQRGLWFAPAVGGEESAYVTVHRALAAYNVAAHSAALQSGVTKR